MSTYTSVVTRNGRVTVPVEIRRSLCLMQGDRVAFVVENDSLVLRPVGSIVDRTARIFARYRRPGPPPTLKELRDAFERGVAEEVMASLEREAAVYRGEA